MSVWTTRVIDCPRCGAPAELQLADSIHVARVPDVRAAILDRTFHRTACPHCAMPIEVQREVLYVDVERGQWILVVPATEAARWPEREAELQRGLARALEHGSPLIASMGDDVRHRLVIGYEQLREKLVLWAASLNDAVIECVKLQMIALDPEIAAPGGELVVDAITRGDDLVVLRRRGNEEQRLLVPRELVQAVEGQEGTLRMRYPELFDGQFVNIARLLGKRYRNPEVPR